MTGCKGYDYLSPSPSSSCPCHAHQKGEGRPRQGWVAPPGSGQVRFCRSRIQSGSWRSRGLRHCGKEKEGTTARHAYIHDLIPRPFGGSRVKRTAGRRSTGRPFTAESGHLMHGLIHLANGAPSSLLASVYSRDLELEARESIRAISFRSCMPQAPRSRTEVPPRRWRRGRDVV